MLLANAAGIDAGRGVDHQLMPQPLHIVDVVHRQLPAPAFDRRSDILLPAAAHMAQSPAQPLGKGKIAERLQDVVQGVDRVPLDGVLRQIGDEHNHYLRVNPADVAGRRHAVQKGHVYTQQKQIELRPVAFHQVLPVVIVGDVKRAAGLFAVIEDKPVQLLKTARVVLCNQDPEHKYATFRFSRPREPLLRNRAISAASTPGTPGRQTAGTPKNPPPDPPAAPP